MCAAFYTSLPTLKPFPKFPVELHVGTDADEDDDTDVMVVCYNNTHGLYGWCGTLTQVRLAA